MSTTSFPPHHSKPSHPISPSLALTHLTTYLTAASTSPSLLPNATLQPTGPIAPSDAASNLTIQHLRRVEAGLRGEWLAPTLDLAEGDANAVVDDTKEGKNADEEMGTDGWQDLDEYQREQSVGLGELGGETVVAIEEGAGEALEVKVTDAAGQKQDKEARKRDKKEKEKALKREKAEKARKGASA
ncbi:hypothetical protein VC83_02989 [Pseudogymnoascus destructans]|uniref:Uncharacterized protein n=1 Tax=Pseudogymnoascus destructans TaxID=655981 RepID=A0A177ADX8_9PEZI|nr:uncharacterized protein VC83_02989 [Pseudogymnoascus destructans]OAF60277.1 hypothetical protein VC83_02989 [Pseudogymnoascus destructans]